MEIGKVPVGGTQFLNGPKPVGFDVRFYADEEGRFSGTVTVDISKQGPPGHVHGGALATLLDEAMGGAAWYKGHRVLAVNLDISFKRAVPLDTEILITGEVVRVEGHKVFAAGKITLPDGTIAVEGKGVFVEAPQYVGNDNQNPFAKLRSES
jgi:uncharacterized protein (TIGR00369 family)